MGPLVGMGLPQDNRILLGELNVTYPAGVSFENTLLAESHILSVPTTLFITPDGKLFRRWPGLASKGQVEELIQQMPDSSQPARMTVVPTAKPKGGPAPVAPAFVSSTGIAAAGNAVAGIDTDVNNDIITDILDLALVAMCWGRTSADPGCASADINGDQVIDSEDLWLVVSNFGPGMVSIDSTSPQNGEIGVAITRETIIRLNGPIDPATVTPTSILARFAGQELATRLHVSKDHETVTLFYQQPLPSSARVRVIVDGNSITDARGFGIDAVGDGLAGGFFTIDFETLGLTTLPNTVVCGRVFASELATGDNGTSVNVPLDGAAITVDGMEDTLRAVTDAMGDFCLDPAPAGRFFVHIDGSAATNQVPEGAYYPFVGKSWESVPGLTTNIGNVYLPLVAPGTLQPVSESADTEIAFPDQVLQAHPELDGVSITVPASSLFNNDGTPGTMVGIAPVAPDRLPGELPPELNFPLVITVQTDGATNFDVPVPACFPNLPDPVTGQPLPSGSKSALWSFNHDTGEWEIVGPMTVSEDGTLVCSDPGVGILAPGWHGTQPGCTGSGGTVGGGNGNGCSGSPPSSNGCGPSGFGWLVPDSPMSGVSFTEACDGHDICYGTCGTTQAQCDQQMFNDARRLCDEAFDSITQPAENFQCKQSASFYFDVVSSAGEGAFGAAQEEAGCNCDAGDGEDGGASGLTVEAAIPNQFVTAQNELSTGLHYFSIVDVERQEVVLRGTAGSSGIAHARVVLSPNTLYRHWILQAATLHDGYSEFTTPDSGQLFEFPHTQLKPSASWDLDFDGLPDIGEAIMGTDLYDPDTDGDGIPDPAEVQQGLDPLGGRPARTGIIATANTPGTAVDVSALNDIAVVADSDAGVAVFNVFNGMSPTLIAQVDTPGDAQQVAISGNLVAVADGSSGLAVVDITDPPAASIVHQIDLGGSAKAVAAVAAAAGIAYVLTSKPPQLVAVDLVGGTVLDRLFLSGTVQDVALGKDHLYVLTVNTNGTIATLHAISLDTFQVVGSATSPRGLGSVAVRHRLSVGNDIAYAVQPRGYNTFSLDDPKRPALMAVGTTTQLGWKQIAPNSSGLGLAAVGPNVSFDGIHNVSLYDVSDPARTDVFLTEFETPGVARSVSIFNGLAYVADHGSGLQVINYLAYDILGVPPTISLSTNFAPGVAEEGHLMRVTAEVSDDVQVRNVEFFLDGERVVTDGNFPFEHRFVTPLIIDQPSFTLRARANDTGGNFTLTDEITVTLVPDATPPRVNRVSPPPGSNLPPPPESVATLSATFNELIDHPTISGATFRLFSPGPDGIAGNADDEPVQGGVVSYLADINTAFLTFDAVLPSSRYRAVLSPPIADLAGNPLAEEHAWTFDVGRLVSWITTADGSWHDPANWSIGALPGAGDFVSIDVDGDITVTHSQSNTSIYNLESRDTLAISGGTLSVATDSTIAALNMSGGTLNIAESLSATDINVSGGNLVVERVLSAAASVTLDSVTATVNGRLNAQDVALLNGSTLTHRQSRVADGPTGVPRLEIEATTLTIDATSSIDVTAKGYLGNGRGTTPPAGAAP